MRQRGRPSALSIPLASIDVIERPAAPAELTEEEGEIWDTVIASESSEWFTPSSLPLLLQYCRHCVHARRIAEMLKKGDFKDKKEYDLLLRMQDRETKAIMLSGTKLRITPQSTINPRGNKYQPFAKKPWQKQADAG